MLGVSLDDGYGVVQCGSGFLVLLSEALQVDAFELSGIKNFDQMGAGDGTFSGIGEGHAEYAQGIADGLVGLSMHDVIADEFVANGRASGG